MDSLLSAADVGFRTVASASGLPDSGSTAFPPPNTQDWTGAFSTAGCGAWQTPVSTIRMNRAQGIQQQGAAEVERAGTVATPHGFSPDGRDNGPSRNEAQ